LVYAFGGVGAAKFKWSEEYRSATVNITDSWSKMYGAFVFGLGGAYKFSKQFSGDLEITRYQIGETLSKSFDYTNGVVTSVSVRAGLSYHFN
jgi:opacity protein-like surface antigen